MMPFVCSIAVVLAAFLATGGALIPPQEWRRFDPAPEPTKPPSQSDVVARLEGLRKRADESTDLYYFTIATDETCGYLSGVVGNAITCENLSLTCAWFAPPGTETVGAVACIDIKEKSFTAHGECVDREFAQNTTVCDDICQSNTFLLRCTETSAPYCRTYVYPSNVSDYRCEKSPQTRVYSASWTWDGEAESDVGFITTTGIGEEAASLTGLKTGMDYTATKIIVVESGSSSGSDSSSTPVGPIVGGVVGGLAVVGAVVLGAIYMLRHKRKTKPDEAAPQIHTAHPTGTQPPMVEAKPYVGSPAPSYSTVAPFPPSSAGLPNQPDWRVPSLIPPQTNVVAPAPQAELSSNPVERSNSIHELG